MRTWRKQPIQRSYVSELDRFIMEFDKSPGAQSASRSAEEAKYEKIDRMRDNSNAEVAPTLWNEF